MADKMVISGKDFEITDEERQFLTVASRDGDEGFKNRKLVAQVLQRAWKAGVLEPDLLQGIFTRVDLAPGTEAKFPFDFYAPDNEGAYEAIVVSQEGAMPTRKIEGDEIRVGTYKIQNRIAWSLDYARDARWDVIGRALEVFNNGFIRKLNNDGWHVVLQTANVGTSTLVDDGEGGTTAGDFTKKLLTNLDVSLKRRSGGRNSRLTDLYLSPEAINDIRNFDNTQIDEVSRRELVTRGVDQIPRLYGINLHEMLEFGESGVYETFLTSDLARAHSNSKLEYVVGLDLLHRDSFVMPVREDMQMFDDEALHRSAEMGVYGWMEAGFASLDTRRAILGQA